MVSRFPVAFRRTGVGLLGILSRRGVGLTVGLPDQACVWTPSGFPRSAHTRRDRAGCPLYPGTALLPQPAFPVRLALPHFQRPVL
jgi:hypothetical protein